MISGVKAQLENIAQLSENEKEGMSSLKTKEYTKALELLDKCLLMASKTPTGPCTTTLDAFSKTHYLLFPKVSYYYLPQLDTLYTF